MFFGAVFGLENLKIQKISEQKFEKISIFFQIFTGFFFVFLIIFLQDGFPIELVFKNLKYA